MSMLTESFQADPDDVPVQAQRPAHIQSRAGVVVEIDAEPDMSVDMCGIPPHVERADAEAMVRHLYGQARQAWADGMRHRAGVLLYDMSAASGHFGLGSGQRIYGKHP